MKTPITDTYASAGSVSHIRCSVDMPTDCRNPFTEPVWYSSICRKTVATSARGRIAGMNRTAKITLPNRTFNDTITASMKPSVTPDSTIVPANTRLFTMLR